MSAARRARPASARVGGRVALLAAVLLAALTLSVGAAAAAGPSATVELRIEGRTSTLFEGPLRSEGHDVRASSDVMSRHCDGTNGGRHASAVPTPTAAAADAMALTGLTFDGRWFTSFDDYLIERWGTEAAAEGRTWSVFSNYVLSSVGGCQVQLHEGAQVLWNLGLATAKPLLMLAPRGTSSGAPPLTAGAEPGVPFEVEVLAYHPAAESEPPAEPTREGAAPFAGATVAPAQTSASGVETVLESDPSAVTTDTEGVASISFSTPGWHRLKAVGTGAVRSNRLDVCVAAAGTGCGAQPADDEVRSVTPPPPPAPEPPGGPSAGPTGQGDPAASTPPPAVPGTGGVAANRDSEVLEIDGLRLAPLDDRAPGIRLSGRWKRRSDRRAWHGTVSLGRRGARLRVRLHAGRPVVVLRDMTRGATVAELLGGRRRVVHVGALAPSAQGLLRLPRISRAGLVELRVLHGELGVDGVAVEH